jgi:hypothetical protein
MSYRAKDRGAVALDLEPTGVDGLTAQEISNPGGATVGEAVVVTAVSSVVGVTGDIDDGAVVSSEYLESSASMRRMGGLQVLCPPRLGYYRSMGTTECDCF